jgi:glycosyltransferase involved in cell wall biosynthesis
VRRRTALLLSENAPVPADRRVWNECRTLRDAGWEVVVACAQDPGDAAPAFAVVEGVEIHRYPLRPSGGGAAGYVREYGQASLRLHALVRRLARERHFDVVHAANPPDFLLSAARQLRRRGTRLIFDHHDLVPELYRTRFGDGAGHRAALAAERLAFGLADVVISTNESYRRIAIERGGRDPADIFVVRNGPDITRFAPVAPDPRLKGDAPHLLAYLGIMGPQDGIDHALHALAWLHARRRDWRAVFVGTGEVVDEMRALATELGIDGHVEFVGWRGDDDIRRILSTADLCLAPDPPSPLNDLSTMMKIPEYLAMGRPVVSYDLHESRVSAGPAALFAEHARPESLGRCVEVLLDDPVLREQMGRAGLRRARTELSWQFSAPILCAAYERALTRPAPAGRPGRLAGRADRELISSR